MSARCEIRFCEVLGDRNRWLGAGKEARVRMGWPEGNLYSPHVWNKHKRKKKEALAGIAKWIEHRL